MKFEEAIETYYFVKSKKKDLGPLIKEYPMIFTTEKKVPLNFQLKMAELSEGNSHRRTSERKFRLSMQSRMNKIELRRNIMKIVLRNRDSNEVFTFLNDAEDDTKVWYYIRDSDNLLQGPLSNYAMQELFEDGELKATTLVKKKLMPDFVQMRYLLNKFCRLRAIQSVDEGQFYDYLAKNSPRKGGGDSMGKEPADIEEWLVVIGKKIEVDPHIIEHSMGLRPQQDSISCGKERLSFVISKESLKEFKSNPNQQSLFERLDVKKAEQNDRKSFDASANQNFGKKRSRHATANFKNK